MADFDSSLPIRTENSGDVVVKVADAAVPSQQLAVGSDGSINTTDNGGSLTVDATNLDIRDLVFASDKVDASGSTVALDAPTLAALESITVQNGAGAAAVNIQDGGNSITVDAVDLDIRDLDSAQDSIEVLQASHDNLNANANLQINNTDASSSNPVPVYVVSEQDGTEVIDYQTSSSVASAASVNHDYTVPGGVTFYGEEAWMTASGKIKAQLLINGAVKWVAFNSTANPNIRIPLEHLAKASATQVVRITLTNLDNQAQDLYSTLLGVTK